MPVFYFILPLYSFWHMDDFSWGTTRQVSAKLSSPKSGDETERSGGDSPTGFEIIDSQVIDADEYARGVQRASGGKKNRHSSAPKRDRRKHNNHASAPPYSETGRLNLQPKLHSSVPVDVDAISVDDSSFAVSATSKTKFDPRKYRDADEARAARRSRRREC